MNSIRIYWVFARPFTLLPPMIGILSGSLIGFGATHVRLPALHIALAVGAAAVLNAASNGLNQICDFENDRVNKPHRPLPSGKMSRREAWTFVAAAYAAALALVAAVNWQTFAIYGLAALATAAYSAPPVRLKRRPLGSNLIIALIRGELLKVAGWAALATVLASIEPWYIGLIYFVFLLGATITKDFADIEGDRAAGCITLPVKYGAYRSARAISPFFHPTLAVDSSGRISASPERKRASDPRLERHDAGLGLLCDLSDEQGPSPASDEQFATCRFSPGSWRERRK